MLSPRPCPPPPCRGLRATTLCCVQIKVEGEASKLNNLRAKHQGAGHPLDDASVAISEAVTALEAAESSCVVCAARAASRRKVSPPTMHVLVQARNHGQQRCASTRNVR